MECNELCTHIHIGEESFYIYVKILQNTPAYEYAIQLNLTLFHSVIETLNVPMHKIHEIMKKKKTENREEKKKTHQNVMCL